MIIDQWYLFGHLKSLVKRQTVQEEIAVYDFVLPQKIQNVYLKNTYIRREKKIPEWSKQQRVILGW